MAGYLIQGQIPVIIFPDVLLRPDHQLIFMFFLLDGSFLLSKDILTL